MVINFSQELGKSWSGIFCKKPWARKPLTAIDGAMLHTRSVCMHDQSFPSQRFLAAATRGFLGREARMKQQCQ